MTNSGRKLERLVEAIERQFVPSGLSVEVRKREFDVEGRPAAEFDVVVSGRLGTTAMSWLIECRDRPSEGSAPAAWIEQLVGRRGRFNFDKVTAVSTTGFAADAIRYAESEGIELRTVQDLDEDEIQKWFRASHLQLHVHKGEFSRVEIKLDSSTSPEVKNAATQLLEASGPPSKILRDGAGNELSVLDAWTHVLARNPHVFAGFSPGADPEFRRVVVSFEEPEDRFVLVTEEGEAGVIGLIYEANLAIELREVPIADATRYSLVEGGETLAESIRFEVQTPEQPFELGFHRMAEDGRTFISFRGSSGGGSSS